jgi:ABC-type transporter Mla subunit MlaD
MKPPLKFHRAAAGVQILAGLVTVASSFLLWRNVSAPAAERSREAFQTLDALQGTLIQLQPQVARIPETSKQTSRTLAELAQSIVIVGTEMDKLLGVSESSLNSVSQSLSLLKTASDTLHGVADNTTWVPNSGFHNFRTQLYADAKTIKQTRSELETLLTESQASVKSIRPKLRDTLNSTAQLLRRYADDLKLMETSVLPSLPPLLDATSRSVGGLALSIDQASFGINLLCLALAGIGFGFVSSGIIRLCSV